MENIIELEVVNKSIKIKYRKVTNILQKYKYHFTFSENWNDLDIRIIFYIDNGRNDKKFFTEYNGKEITPNSEIFTKEYEGKSLFIGACGVKDNFVYPTPYCYLGKISLALKND